MATKSLSEIEIRQRTMGFQLHDWRVAAGLTQKDVAEALGYSTPQFVSNWERGISLPPLDVMPVLAKLFGLSRQDVIFAYEACLQGIQKRNVETLRGLFTANAKRRG